MLRSLTRKSFLTFAFGLALVIFLVIGWQLYRSMDSIRDADSWENHTYQVLNKTDRLFSAVQDAETGQRGFIITGLDEYLEPYHSALSAIASRQSSLRELTRDNRGQQERLVRLEILIQKRLDILREIIEIRRARGLEPAAEALKSQRGKVVMDQIRRAIEEFGRQEQELLRQRSEAKNRGLERAFAVYQGGSAAIVAVLVAVFLLLTREVSQRAGAERDLALQNAELRRVRDRERDLNWVKGGINELNARLGGDQPMPQMTAEALSFLSGYLGAGAAALYLFDERAALLRVAANWACTGNRELSDTIRLGEGLAGQAARERRTLVLDRLPPEYLTVSSALGEAAPASVLALPLQHDQRLMGVLELGSFQPFGPLELDFLKEAGEVLGLALGVSLSRQLVDELLQQSQSQEEELRVQQEELQQSNEELEERAQLLERQREQIQAKNREIEKTSRELVLKARELEQASGYKSEFLANMSHELRTPLNSLMILSGYLQENREGNLTAKQVEYAATIKSAGKDLLHLINDILDLSKVEAGRMEFLFREADLAELCDQVAAGLRPLADQKGLSFDLTVDPGVPPRVTLDAQRAQQVIKNLLSNAVKFTPGGSVALRVYLPGEGEHPLPAPSLAFAVSDTGIGIPAEQHESVFQAFQQADGSTSRRFGGTGLGLSISRQLARGMQGEILLESGAGRGSVFTLYLPLSPAPGVGAAVPGASCAARIAAQAPAARAFGSASPPAPAAPRGAADPEPGRTSEPPWPTTGSASRRGTARC